MTTNREANESEHRDVDVFGAAVPLLPDPVGGPRECPPTRSNRRGVTPAISSAVCVTRPAAAGSR